MAIKSQLLNKNIPLTVIYDDQVFMLVEITEKIRYEDGVRTDKTDGYNYAVVDLKRFEKIQISVLSKKALINNDELQKARENGQQFYVEFVNPTVKAYKRFKNGNLDDIYDSYSADDIAFVETN